MLFLRYITSICNKKTSFSLLAKQWSKRKLIYRQVILLWERVCGNSRYLLHEVTPCCNGKHLTLNSTLWNDSQDLKFPRFFTRQKCDPDVLRNHEYVARSKCVMRSIRSCLTATTCLSSILLKRPGSGAITIRRGRKENLWCWCAIILCIWRFLISQYSSQAAANTEAALLSNLTHNVQYDKKFLIQILGPDL